MRLRRRHIISSRRYPIRSAEDIGFNEWLYQQYGISSDDMTDEDYDEAYNDYQDYLKSCQSIHAYEDLNDEEVDISDYEYCGNREGYQVYRKIVNDSDGKHHGEWAAQDQDRKYPPFKITYMQARGYDPIDKYDSDVKKLGRELGRMLLPNSCTSIKSSEDADTEFEEYEDDIKEIDQEFTSENTSINSTKLPAVFKMVSFEPGTVNIDYGGGRFDNVADYLSKYDVINLVYDPYNRTPEHNKEVIKLVKDHGGADTATCSNVLNVIKEPEVRLNVLKNIKKLVKPSGEVYITVYEGTGKGDEGATKSGYQLNRKTADYLEEIQQVFPDAKRKGKLIVAHPSGSVNSSVKAAYYGGAFDIDPHEFFTKEEIVEFGYDVADKVNETVYRQFGESSEFDLEDTYVEDYNCVVVELFDKVAEITCSGQATIDMRRIRRPRDLYKYESTIVDQIVSAYSDYVGIVASTKISAAKQPSTDMIIDQSSEIVAGTVDGPDPSRYAEDYYSKTPESDVETVTFPFEFVVTMSDGGQTLSYDSDDTPWGEFSDIESEIYPGKFLDSAEAFDDEFRNHVIDDLPEEDGQYKISGTFVAKYHIEYFGNNEYDGPNIQVDKYQSEFNIENLNVEKV